MNGATVSDYERKKDMKGMKKTNYSFMVSWGMSSYNGIWRRVYEQDGKFYVKYENKLIDVTRAKNDFVTD